jgi:DDE superfamily endonuclease
VAQVGEVGGQRLALPLALIPAPAADPSPSGHARALVRAAVQQCTPDDALVLDAGFPLALLQEEGATRYVVRLAKNATFRRATPPPYRGRGRPPTRGVLVRPLPRRSRGRRRAPAGGHGARRGGELGGRERTGARGGVARPGAAHRQA